MLIHALIQEIDTFLQAIYKEADTWFDKAESLRKYVPEDNAWSIDEILEHIVLTNKYLLILVEKGTNKALRNVQNKDLAVELEDYVFHKDRLDEVGFYKSFVWVRPEHMQPKGEKKLADIRDELDTQVLRCRCYLAQLKNGEGILYKTTMSVNQLGKIDIYEYIYFLGKHIERHIQQMKKNELAFSFL